jgi:hypothetical protein
MGRVRVPSVHCLCVPSLLLPRGCSCSCVYVCVCVIYQKHARSMEDGVNRRILVCVCAFTLTHTEVQRDIYSTYSRFIHNLLDMMRLRAHPTTPTHHSLKHTSGYRFKEWRLEGVERAREGATLDTTGATPASTPPTPVSAQLIGDCLWQCSAFSSRAPSHLSVSYSLSLKHIQILVCVCACVRARKHARTRDTHQEWRRQCSAEQLADGQRPCQH